jgi:8-oxo-dGTP pyrophosphatase MutT (NUDIX family)
MIKVHKALMFIYRMNNGRKEFFVLNRKAGDHVVLTGHQEKGETIKDTAIRETIEEIEIKPMKVKDLNEINTVVLEGGTKESTEHAFLIEIPNKEVKYLKGKEEHSWCEVDRLERVLSYNHQKKVAKYIKKILDKKRV